MAPEIIFH